MLFNFSKKAKSLFGKNEFLNIIYTLINNYMLMENEDIVKKLKDDGFSFEDTQRFLESIKQIEDGDTLTLEESKKSFNFYKKNLIKKENLCIK